MTNTDLTTMARLLGGSKRTILFDFGDTLVRYYTREESDGILAQGLAAVRRHLQRARPHLVLADPQPEMVQEERAEAPDYRVRPLERRLARIFGLSESVLSPEEWCAVCRAFLDPIAAVAAIYPDTLPILHALGSAGFALGILSNAPWGMPADLWRGEIRRHIPAALVEYVGVCGDCGWRKPAPEPFRHALAHFRCAGDACLFVGDHPEWDVRGPIAAGLDAVLLDRVGRHASTPLPRINSLAELLHVLGRGPAN